VKSAKKSEIDSLEKIEREMEKEIDREKQVGGNHYSKCKIQPIEYIMANKLGYCEGNIVKYITRWRDKGGMEDLDKIIQYVEFLKNERKA
jgi:Protein of unknwon function (DUF3310)